MIRVSMVPAVPSIYFRAIRGAASRRTKGGTTTSNTGNAHTSNSGTHENEGTSRLLQCYGVDLEKVSRKYPYALRYNVAKTQAAVEVLTRHNIDVRKAFGRRPQLLSLAPQVLDTRLILLKKLLGDQRVPHAIANCPGVLGLLPSTVNTKSALLASLGLDAKVLSRRLPQILTCSEFAIRSRISFFDEVGLDALRIINGKPEVVLYDIQRTIRPTIEYITNEMGRSLEDINNCPRVFGTSLERRLKPRHEYLKQHGRRQDYSLSSLCASTDTRFVLLLSDRAQEDYRRWLATRFQ